MLVTARQAAALSSVMWGMAMIVPDQEAAAPAEATPFWPTGPSTSGIFELKSSAQYLFKTRGGASVPRYSRARTMLLDHASGRSFDVASAEIGAGLAANTVILTSGSLLLAPGRYSWFSEVSPQPFDQVTSCRLRVTVANSPEMIETRGERLAISAMGGNSGTDVFARASITAEVGDSEEYSAQVSVVNLMTNEEFTTPPLQGVGPTGGEVVIGVVPYVLTAGHVFRATLRVNYAGAGRVGVVLRQTYA